MTERLARGTTDRRVTVTSADRRLTASFSVGERDGVVVERAGTLRDLEAQAADDLLVGGFNAACDRAGRTSPRALHVRATSTVPPNDAALAVAASVAGAAAANGLLGLGLPDEAIAGAAEAALGRHGAVADAERGATVDAGLVGGFKVAVRQSCPD